MNNENDQKKNESSPRTTDESLRNNPGRTPGQAEGGEREIESALRNEERKDDSRS